MSDLETTQAKLRSTPTAGVSGEHSPYFRKLASAGYKGYVQGMIAGGSLYGTMGLVVGAVVAVPAAALLTSALPLLAIPAVAGIGALHGAHSFADISKTAAMLAESAETNEKRRYLLDRYYETPNDAEAAEIRNILEQQMKPQVAEQMFHWRTVVVGALIGLAVTGGLLMLAASPAAGLLGLGEAILHIGEVLGLDAGVGIAANAGILAFGTALGTAAGGLIGLDREYVRRWLDKAEFAVHDASHTEREMAAREQEVSRLGSIAKEPQPVFKNAELEKLVLQTPPAANVHYRPPALAKEAPALAEPAAAQPSTHVRDAKLQERVAQLQQALAPTV